MNDYKTNYERWLNCEHLDEELRQELLQMSPSDIQDAFFKNAEFGTGGLRGKLGAGTNRLNRYTLARVTIGFGIYLLRNYPDAKSQGVAISHDNRRYSREFALQTAEILNKMGIDAYLFDALRPTPELSFAVRKLHCCGGVMITASHNPKEYNGYKVYDHHGCQLVPSQVEPLIDIISSLPDELTVSAPLSEVKGKSTIIGKEIDDAYVEEVKAIQVHPELDKSSFKIVYSPQHGASYEVAMRVFEECGYHVIPVAPQCVHDPEFGATSSPNPELKEAWTLSLEYAKKDHADIAVMTDPDGDRCGIAYLSSKGKYERLTGNESAALLIDYLFHYKQEKGLLPKNGVIYDTIVTSGQGRKIAASYGVSCESFLTGFKYIGERIDHYEDLGEGPTFLFGYEESYGCLVAPFVRDKDGVQAILMYSEMALYYKNQGLALDEAYENLQKKTGYYYNHQENLYFEGMAGANKMVEITSSLRNNPPSLIKGKKVVRIEDYLQKTILEDGVSKPILSLPASDMIAYRLEDHSSLIIRPSGTEPKIKIYIEVVSSRKAGLAKKAEELYRAFCGLLPL